ncbi:MAG: ABC transporter-related protein [Candidatus Woesebacteria bacterium GW2011_GWD1_38_10]|uniref:ABC transporter-related protein n=4 Tax=Candidatus Woeseibacteriota TaxID=1752722 RepID=A0A0G0L8E1_9BACT|nr:MAG: ABC transporter-related protein [Candidatus Woesebacteria bacterium GW2011_GWD1_38_10]KKQ84110.1 MAG: ABC transporter-related protein [Candidatus Woesebacteria bacterium GW2011_GWA1_38_8]
MFKILKTFYKFFFKKRGWAVIFVILIIVSPILESLSPYFFKLFIDEIPSYNYSKLINILVLYLVLRMISMLFDTGKMYVGDILGVDASAETMSTIFSHIHKLDFAYHTTKSSGSLISAFKRGDGAYWNIYFSIHYRVVSVLVRFMVLLYFFKNLDITIFLIIIATFLLTSIVTAFFVKLNIYARRKVNDYEDEISGVIVDNMINFETVKLFAKENWEQQRLIGIQSIWKKAVWKYVYTFRGFDIVMGLIINSSIFLILLLSLQMTIKNEFSIGDFVLVASFLQSFFPHLFDLVWGFRDIAKSYADIQKYFGLLDNEIKIKDPIKPLHPKKLKGEIEFQNVTFAYDKNKNKALKNINLKVRQGQSVALVGRSGAGKTSLVKLLLRFYDPDKGTVVIDGTDIKKFTKSQLRENFGVVPQEPVLFNNSILYNIKYGNSNASKQEVEAAAKIANIHDFINHLPEKYDTQVGERGIKLSGGQKQRLAIARMILSDPEIIIFDEATSQLDSESEKLIQEAFWKAAYGKTVMIIAHRLSTIQRADKIAVLDRGKIVEEGSHKDLLFRGDSLYSHFWELQVKRK